FSNLPPFSAEWTVAKPAWICPQACSMRQRATNVGMMSCDGLKNAAFPRHALVMLLATVVPPIVAEPVAVEVIAGVVKAEQADSVGIWLVSVKNVPNGPAKFG